MIARESRMGVVSLTAFLGIALGLTAGLAACTAPPSAQGNSSATENLSLSPAGDQAYRCLKEKGWDVTLTWDGGIEASSDTVPAGQKESYDADSQECWGKIDARIAAMTEAEIRKVYTSELTTLACLADLGYAVEEPPSEQAYVDSFHGRRWSAYTATDFPEDLLRSADWKAVNEKCPQPALSLGVD